MDNEPNQPAAETLARAAELDRKLSELAAKTETVFDVNDPVEVIARSVGEVFRPRRELFFRTSDRTVVARGADGQWEPMDQTWAVTYFPEHGVKWTKGKRKANLKQQMAAEILRATAFRDALPKLNGVNPVRLPVVSEDLDERGFAKRKGFGKIRLLPIGYDEETGIWTEDGIDYPEDIHSDDAVEWFDRLYKYFDWTDPNRQAVQMAACLSVYMREMFDGRPPIFVWNSNIPGSGKSRLAEMIGRMIFGACESMTLDQINRRELEQLLHTCALNDEKIVWFDDVEGKLYASELRQWATAKSRGGRAFHSQKKFYVDRVRSATFVTGTHLKIDEHLERRSLYVDLFPVLEAKNRRLPADAMEITDEWLDDPENRSRFLGCLWALVRRWDEANRPLGPRPKLASFEGWSRMVPGAVACAGFGDCLAPFEAPDAGGLDTSEAKQLVEALIKHHAKEFDGKGYADALDVIAEARKHRLFVHVLGDVDLIVQDLDRNPRWRWVANADGEELTMGQKLRQAARYRDAAIDSKWGKLWNRLACQGRTFVVDGRAFSFGRRDDTRTKRYDIVEVELPG
jgi:hypothetical protein